MAMRRSLQREPTGAGGQARTGLGVGSGVFDAVYTPAEDDLPLARYGKCYASESDWAPAVAQDWEERLDDLRVQWAGSGVTVRLFKVGWQGRELSKEATGSVLQ